jgi:hypothetical protein
MRKLLTGAIAALTFASGAVVAETAQAQGVDRSYIHRVDHDDDEAAIVAGVAGLALGAALASGGRGGYYYGPSYYRPYSGYYQPYGYGYYQPRRYYRSYRYYDRPRYRTRRCRTVTFWDPYYGRIRERRCW